jgi:F0F1-type ATP synthase assembly protein I
VTPTRTPLASRPIRVLLAWQAVATLAFAALGGWWEGRPGAVSGALGAAINLVANFVYALMAGLVRPQSAFGALLMLLRAESFKVAMVLVQLVLVMLLYRELAPGPFIVAFIATALMFGIALSIRND